MASVRREIHIHRSADAVWDAVRDIAAAHVRLFPGVLVDAHAAYDGRVVTFANGLVIRETTVELNDETRRYAWTALSERMTHHKASLQVFENGDGSCRIVWITDVLPHARGGDAAALMDAGAPIMKRTLEAVTASISP